ncbi:DUF4430 domain-containing protein [Caloramator mitchellensis]|uniref:DUF4430 domain-containing protein n=1 Tax=Caloramator mitchellensis TaxID=908809 RepID=UPI001364DB08|nr:DUF4430 domain-containing protein [Caloramator mitchellensis]
MKFKFIPILITLFILTSCSKNQDNTINSDSNTLPEGQKTSVTTNVSNVEQKNKSTNEIKPQSDNKEADVKKQNEIKEVAIKLVISKDNKIILLEKVVKLNKSINALRLLKENAEVYEEGGFIKSINGLESIPPNKLTDEDIKKGILGYDWFIYLNGKKTSVGAKDILLKNGDEINFNYKGWTVDDLAP